MSGRRTVGWILVALSAIATAQSVREFAMSLGDSRWKETPWSKNSFDYAGHHFTITDDQPTDSVSGQREFPGTVQLNVDGRPLGPPLHAGVRRGLKEVGRYHSWVSVSQFRDVRTNETSLWIARKIEPKPSDNTRYEITTVSPTGVITQRTVSGWRLGFDYPMYAITGLLVFNEWSVFPLSYVGLIMFPVLLVVYPIATTIVGVVLLRMRKRVPEP